MSKPGHPVLVTGATTEPAFNGVPVNMSSDDKELVMEYSDMFEPSRGSGFIDIQEGDAISESSDTEIVAHTKEQVQYDNPASSSETNSDDDDDDGNNGPPPLNSDDEEDNYSVDGPPPLDSDDNAENTDDELPISPPDSGSREELDLGRVPVDSERRFVKSSEGSESESDSEGGVKEAPPPLDSEDDDEGEEVEAGNSGAENGENATVEATENHVLDSPLEDVDNDDEERRDDDDDVDNTEHDNRNSDDDDDEEDETEERNDASGEDGIDEQGKSDAEEEEEEEDEKDDTQAEPSPIEAVTHEVDDSDETGQADDPPAEVTEGQIPAQQQSSEEEVEDEEEEEEEAKSDNEPIQSTVEEADIVSAANAQIGTAVLSGKNSQGGDYDDQEEANGRKDAVSSEPVQKGRTVITEHADPTVEEVSDSDEPSEFVADEEDNELEWDVEDFDLPKKKSSKTTSKVDKEGLEVDKLKKSFLDTLKSEAEQRKVLETEPKKKEKSSKGLNAKNSQVVEEKKPGKDFSKNAPARQVKNAPGSARRATKDIPPKTEPVKLGKTSVKDEVENTSKHLATSKPVDSTAKPLKAKSKAVEDVSLDKTEKRKTGKQRKDGKQNSTTSEVQSSEMKAAVKPVKAKSASSSSLPTGDIDQQRTQTALPAKEKKKKRASTELAKDLQSHKKETDSVVEQKRTESRKPRTSDSDTVSDSSARQRTQKTSSTASVAKQKKSNAAVLKADKERAKAGDSGELRQSKPKRTAPKAVVNQARHEDDRHFENKRHSGVLEKSVPEAKTKSRVRPTSNGYLSSSQEKLLSQSVQRERGAKERDTHRHGGPAHGHHHAHDRSKHVWLCRDDEIHKLIAQKASLLKEYESGSLAGRKVFSGHKSRYKREEDLASLPDVGFISSKEARRHQSRPLSEAIPDRAPYSSQRKDKRRSLQLRYSGSSSDDDERTNRAVGSKRGGTFAVGLAARNIDHKDVGGGESESDHEESCEYCAAEKAAAAAKAREKNPAWEGPHHPRNLLLGVVYTAKYLGSSQIMSPQSPNKAVRMEQAQEAVGRIKVPEGEDQPTTDVDLFISTERLKVVNTSTKEVMLDHALRTVSFIADIGDVLVIMARQPPEEQSNQVPLKPSQILASVGTAQTDHKNIKITCHVFQSPEAQVIAKSIGQAFNVAYQEFLRQNGLSEDVVEDAEYNGVLEAQKILGEDLSLLADENSAKEVIVNKKPHEHLGVMIVESGWGSMIPCAIIAHLAKDGPAAKSGRLNVGDQILSVNGTSLVGLPLLECQNIIKGIRPATKVIMKIVSCPPTVQVVVNRPDTKYQLGFSVQNGMICSLMRGSIAERGGVRVGHRIIEINNESVVATTHQHIVELLATTVGEIRMKTMPASMYRLLVGLEAPQHI